MTMILVTDGRKPSGIFGDLQVVSARDYMKSSTDFTQRGLVVLNACRSYRYQSAGYYVSLLATARGHRPLPSVATLQALRSPSILRVATTDLDSQIASSLRDISGDRFELSIYFGTNLAKRHERLARTLFNLFPAPFLRAFFVRESHGWELRRLQLIPITEIPPNHESFVIDAATGFFVSRLSRRKAKAYRFDLAILYNPEEPEKPSNRGAIARFKAAARRAGMRPVIVGKDDYGRLSTFDALLIRETTHVNHHTFRFAQRAEAEGLAVIDDPESIIRCTNKVYLAEMLERHKVPSLKTVIVHKDDAENVSDILGLPVVLKKPDSGFSQGVYLAKTPEELKVRLATLFSQSDLVLAQRYEPTSFDWRIGILEGKPLFACKYHMANGHWQVIKHDSKGKVSGFGRHETFPVEEVPPDVLKACLRAASPIGRGLYGVDCKEIQGRPCVVEVNDNPNIDHGVEDEFIGDSLYDRVIGALLRRIEEIHTPAGDKRPLSGISDRN